jgi:Leucine-rich repeat (LRR) protein
MKYRFSLRTALGGVFAMGILFALLANEVVEFERYRRQDKAISALSAPWNIVLCTNDYELRCVRGKVYSLLGVHMRMDTEMRLTSRLPREDLAAFAGVKDCFSLRSFYCQGAQIDDEELDLLAAAPHLQIFSLRNSPVTARGIRHLRRLPELRTLRIEKSIIPDDLAVELSALTKLKTLDVSGSTISDRAAAAIGASRSLEELDCTNSSLTDEGAAEFVKLPRLKTLTLAGTPITGAGLFRFAPSPTLTHLDLASRWGSWSEFEQVDPDHEARPLDISGLAGNRTIECLQLHGRSLGPASLAALGSLVGLRELGLIDSAADDATLQSLQGLPRLAILLVSGSEISDDGLKCCRKLPALKKLSLSRNRIGDKGLEYLKSAKSLEELDLVATNVTASGLLALKGHPSLKHVYVDMNLPDDSLAAVQQAISTFQIEQFGRYHSCDVELYRGDVP